MASVWCQRLAVISVPFFILTIFLHRSSSITTQQAMWLIAFGIGMLLASLVFGLKAANDLWEKGYKGGRATVNGIVLSVLLLIPFGIQLSKALENPQLHDVSTDVVSPPLFLEPVKDISGNILSADTYDDYTSRLIVSNYPELVTRRYVAPQERVISAIVDLLKRWDWTIKASENLPVVDNAQDAGKGSEEKLAGGADEINKSTGDNPVEILPDIIVQVEARSFLMKLPSYLVIKVSSEDDNTQVDMRSASYWGQHDFGGNADNINQFLEALDTSLAGIAGEQ